MQEKKQLSVSLDQSDIVGISCIIKEDTMKNLKYYVCIFQMLSAFTVLGFNVIDESCIISMVIPKEKIKSTCNNDAKMIQMISLIEEKTSTNNQGIKEVRQALTREEEYSNNGLINLQNELKELRLKVENLQNRAPVIVSNKLEVNDRIGQIVEPIEKDIRDDIMDILVPYVNMELQKHKANVTREITDYIKAYAVAFNQVLIINRKQMQFTTLAPTMKSVIRNSKIKKDAINFGRSELDADPLEEVQYSGEIDTSVIEKEVRKLRDELKSSMNVQNELIMKVESLEDKLKQATDVKKTYAGLEQVEEQKVQIKMMDLSLKENYKALKSSLWVQNTKVMDLSEIITRLTNNVSIIHHEVMGEGTSTLNSLEEQSRLNNPQTLKDRVKSVEKRVYTVKRLTEIFQQTVAHHRNESIFGINLLKNNVSRIRQKLDTFIQNVSDSMSALGKADLEILRDDLEFNNEIQAGALTGVRDYMDRKIDNIKLLIEDMEDKMAKFEVNVKKSSAIMHANLTKQIYNYINESKHTLMGNISRLNKKLQSVDILAQMGHDKWIKYNFSTISKSIGCNGDKYVRKSRYEEASVVGVVLCSSFRYKILLSDHLKSDFLAVGDKHGVGEDHCEFVGAKQGTVPRQDGPLITFKSEVGKYQIFITVLIFSIY